MAAIKETTCRACGEPILMIKMVNRKTMPVNVEKVWAHPESGGETLTTDKGDVIFGRVVGDAADDEQLLMECYRSHFMTCTVGARRRRR